MKRYPGMKVLVGPWFDLYYFHDRMNDVTRWDVQLESAQLYFTKMLRHGDPTPELLAVVGVSLSFKAVLKIVLGSYIILQFPGFLVKSSIYFDWGL